MEITTAVLGGLAISVISGVVGKSIGSNDNVKKDQCVERQHACSTLVISKIDNLADKFVDLKKSVDNKLLSL